MHPILPILVAALLIAAPAAAQDNYSLARSIELRAEQDMAQQRMNTLQNEIHALESRSRTEQTLRDLQSQREPLRVRPLAAALADAVATSRAAGGYASIPDQTLAESNARVRAFHRGR